MMGGTGQLSVLAAGIKVLAGLGGPVSHHSKGFIPFYCMLLCWYYEHLNLSAFTILSEIEGGPRS